MIKQLAQALVVLLLAGAVIGLLIWWARNAIGFTPACNVVARANASGVVEQPTLRVYGNGARHAYGMWTPSGYKSYQQRSCVRCGWTEFAEQ